MEPVIPANTITGFAPGVPLSEATVVASRPALLREFTRLGLAHHDAEDCTQETLLRVQASLVRYVPRAPFGAFLRRVARNVFSDWCRRQRVRRAAHVPLESSAARHMPSPASLDPGDILDLRAAVDRLPPKLAQVIELSARQGHGYAQVAARLGIPEGTVKSRMFLAVRRLRKELGHGS